MKVAVLGAGFQGACVALELARRGFEVDLVDRAATPITQAGLYNEGKIHLGFVYANDASLRTAKLMVRGSMRFGRILGRWIDNSSDALGLSTPFYYAVHRDSMLGVDGLRRHYAKVAELIRQDAQEHGTDYLHGPHDHLVEELSSEERQRLFDSSRVQAAFLTAERSVDPIRVAGLMRSAIEADSKIRFVPGVEIKTASFDGKWIVVAGHHDGARFEERYDRVVNALWGGRLAVDETIGLAPRRKWLHRFKYGLRLTAADGAAPVPSTTIVLGRYGDIVRFPENRLYLSWYPECLEGMSTHVLPLACPQEPPEQKAQRVFERSYSALAAIAPSLAGIDRSGFAAARVRGGSIFAWGETDIGHKGSALHTRYDIGITSLNGYYSVDTGKYCTAPLFALGIADRICPEPLE